MATAADESYEVVKDELALVIRKRRSDCIPGEAARQLLAYDTPDHTHIVGIDFEGANAVYYACEANEVIFVRFGLDGLADGGPVMGPFEGRRGVAEWIEKLSVYWGWLHPRYR